MQLLSPLFLLGLLLLAIPFWLHKLKTETPERKTFASSMFLKASDDPVHVRSKLRYLFLMAMRLLFLLLLALVFTQPFWPRESAPLSADVSNFHLILVDSSASMGATGKTDKARDMVEDILSEVAADEAAQLFSIDQSLHQLSEMQTNLTPAGFDDLTVSSLPLNYDAVARAVESLMSIEEEANHHYQIHVVSDFQQTSMPSRFADLVPEPTSAVSYELSTYSVASINSNNINLAIDQVTVLGQEVRISVRSHVEGNPNNTGDPIEFGVRAKVGQSEWLTGEGLIEPSGRTTVVIDGLVLEPIQNQLQVELLVEDQLAIDNQFYHIEDRATPEPLLLLTDNPVGSSALYISALFAEQVSESTGRNYVAKPEIIAEFDARTLDRYSWVLIDDIGSIGPALSEDLVDYITDGGAVFAASGNNVGLVETLAIADLPIASQETETVLGEQSLNANRFKAIASVDQGHAVLNELTGWGDLRFEKWLSITDTADADVLIELEGSTPLFIEKVIGRGKLMLLTSSLDNQWNNLPVKPLFVAMMRNVAQYLSGAELIEPQALAGDTLNFQGNSAGAGQLINPDGDAVLALGDSLQSGRLRMNETGFYQAYTASGEYWIGVNVHPNESELLAVTNDSLAEWEQLATRAAGAQTAISTNVRSTQNDDNYYTKLWFWLLLIAAAALLIETLLANRYLSSNVRVIQSGPVR